MIRADGQLTSHAGLEPSTCPPYVLPVPILHLGMVEQVNDFKETCSASPPAAVMVVMAVGIEPGLPAYKPCLLTTTLPQLTHTIDIHSCMPRMPYGSLQMSISWNGLSMPTNIRSVHKPIGRVNFKVKGVK